MSVIDKVRFETRGARGCSNSDYRLCQATCCGRYCVEDEELGDLYLDPADLGRTVSLLGAQGDLPPPCPMCGAPEWDLTEVRELPDVPASWTWACTR